MSSILTGFDPITKEDLIKMGFKAKLCTSDINNRYNIAELLQACRDYIYKTNRRISFEYALAKDNNDNLDDAKRLVKLLKGMICHVNLIPINKIENGSFIKSSNENIMKFRDFLNEHGVVATIRRELGSDIDAACGQLRRKNLK